MTYCDTFARSQKKGVRLAYMGHLTLISEDVISALTLYPVELSETLAHYCPQPQWDAYVSGRFKETKDRDSTQLGGGKPMVTARRLTIGTEAIPGPPGTIGLSVDEAERLPSASGVGSSNMRSPVQNVLFSDRNLDEERGDSRPRNSRLNPQSEEVCISLHAKMLHCLTLWDSLRTTLASKSTGQVMVVSHRLRPPMVLMTRMM